MIRKLKYKHFIPIALVVLLVITSILYIFRLHLEFYVIGGLLGIVSHMLMIVQNRAFMNVASNRFEREMFHPKKSSVLWYILRLVIVGGTAAAVIYFMDVMNNPDGLVEMILLLSGFITIKALFLVYIFIVKEEGEA